MATRGVIGRAPEAVGPNSFPLAQARATLAHRKPLGSRTEKPDAISLTLYFHPLASFCQKVLVALYETETRFTPHIVDLLDPASNAAFRKIWSINKLPVLRDEARNLTIPESTIIIEYLAEHHPGRTELVSQDAELARQARLADRFFDLYINVPMQKIVTDRLRPAGKDDAYGVEEARELLRTALGMVDEAMAAKTWAIGEAFTMADCAAAPALFYADMVMPFGDTHENAASYLRRLMERPSFACVVEEAAPYRADIPAERRPAEPSS